MEEENYKETNIILGILLTILIALNSLAILFIIGVTKVEAASPDYWYDNFKTPMYVEYWGWTSNTSHNTIATKKMTWEVQGNTLDKRNTVVNTNLMTLDTLGLTFRITTQETMKSNYLYSWQIAVCSSKSMDNISYYSVTNQSDRSSNYSYGTKINMSSVPSYSTWTSCKVFSGLVEDTEGSNNLYIRIKPSSTITSEDLWLLGYNLQGIGLFEQYMFSTINGYIASQSTELKTYMDTKANIITNLMTQQQQATQQQIQQSTEQQTQELIGDDMTEQEKEQADNTGVENYEQAEENLQDMIDTNSINNVSLSLDINSNNWIWNTMTSLINTSQAIYTLVISILSIGVIKLVLVR